MNASSVSPRPAHRAWLLTLGLSAVLSLANSLPVRAETTTASGATMITAIPCQINTAGTYALAQNLSLNQASGTAIEVDADDVTIDLNGHTLSNNYPTPTTNGSFGILGNCHNRLTVRNGTIRGFWAGVYLLSNPQYGSGSDGYTYGHLIEDLSLCEQTALGVCSYANDSVLRNLHIFHLLGQESGQPYPTAIQINGANDRVLNCDLGHISNPGNGCYSIGIYFAYGVAGGCAVGNRVNPSFSGGTTQGIICADSTVKLADNIVAAGVTNPYAGGTDAGNNN